MMSKKRYRPRDPMRLHDKVEQMLMADEFDQGTNLEAEELLRLISEHYIR